LIKDTFKNCQYTLSGAYVYADDGMSMMLQNSEQINYCNFITF